MIYNKYNNNNNYVYSCSTIHKPEATKHTNPIHPAYVYNNNKKRS